MVASSCVHRILVVDDSAVIRTLLRGAIELHRGGRPIEIVEAPDGGAALAAVRGGGIDVVLLDSHMPHVDGLTAIRSLRAEGSRVPIIVVTADADPAHRASAESAGCDAYILKPFRLDQLWKAVEPFLP